MASTASQLQKWVMVITEGSSPGEIMGQFAAQDVTEDIAAVWSGTSTIGREQPIWQFVNGEADQLTFTARLYADSYRGAVYGDPTDLSSKINSLKALCRKDAQLGRPPTVLFTIGAGISFTAFVQSIGGIRYDEPWADGRIRGASFSITLIRYDAYTLSATNPTATPKESLEYHVTELSLEAVALKHYGDPKLGDYLRQHSKNRHLLNASLGVIDTIATLHVPARKIAITKAVAPASIPLADSDEVKALKRAVSARHAGTHYSRVALSDL